MSVRTLIAGAVLLAAGAASAQVPHAFSARTPARAAEVNENFAFLAAKPRVFATRACTSADCSVAAVTSDRNNRGTNWIELASLDLPQGSWMVVAKLTAWNDFGFGYILDCAVADAAGTQSDEASISYDAMSTGLLHLQTPLTMQIPVKFDSSMGGKMSLTCRAVGKSVTTADLTTMHVWGVAVTAVEVASIAWQTH